MTLNIFIYKRLFFSVIPAIYNILHAWSWGKISWRNQDILQYIDYNFLQKLVLVSPVVYKPDKIIYSFVFAIFQAGLEQYQEYFNFYIQLVCFLLPCVVYIAYTMLVYGGQWIDD